MLAGRLSGRPGDEEGGLHSFSMVSAVPITPLRVEKSVPAATSRLWSAWIPRFEQEFCPKWDSDGPLKVSDPQAGDFFNTQAHYTNHFPHFSA
jgi:hypothetical protein